MKSRKTPCNQREEDPSTSQNRKKPPSHGRAVRQARQRPNIIRDFPEGVPETPPVNLHRPPIDPQSAQVQEALRQSELNANRLDGVPGPISGPIYRWQQRAGHDHLAPYFGTKEWFLAEEQEAHEEVDKARQTKLHQLARGKAEKDEWTLDWQAGTMTRHHRRKEEGQV